MGNAQIGSLELAILLTVARLGEDAYGLGIRRDVSARLNRDYSVGAVYTTLERLEEKGLVRSYKTEPLPTRGGRSRRQFKVTASGQRAIRQAERVANQVWAGLGTLKPERA
jgi:DNA-binding PadR family transcriptional regulator